MTEVVPVALEPVLLPKVWGGDRLAAAGLPVPSGARIGEAWMVADMARTAPTGAGGQAIISRVASGPLAGTSLTELSSLWARDLFGGSTSPSAPMPVLVKLLDAREHLSVQVHPSPAYAAAHPAAHLKTECWYVLTADPGAVLYLGTRPGVTLDQLRAAATDGTIAERLVRVAAVPGTAYLLPSGLIHALGAGVVVAEIQTPSDTTFRLYDWTDEYGRAPRAMHVDASLAACDLSAGVVTRARGAAERRAVVADTPYFVVEELLLAPGESVSLAASDARPCVVLMLDGAAEVRAPDERCAAVACHPAAAVLVPAVLVGAAQLVATTSAARALVVHVLGGCHGQQA